MQTHIALQKEGKEKRKLTKSISTTDHGKTGKQEEKEKKGSRHDRPERRTITVFL
jgi:hypothetical protein